MLSHHERIAAEYEESARDAKRERRQLALKTVAWCWLWVMIGAGLFGEGLHINASVGWVVYPDLMARAQLFAMSGIFVGTAGPVATLFVAWRLALNRGLLD
jgi:hypothetical protein